MPLPFFFHPELAPAGQAITLGEEASKHIVTVLRMQAGEMLQLTDGKGGLATARISSDHRKKCEVQVELLEQLPQLSPQVVLAVSPLKNNTRFEWLLEKAAELGVASIAPLLCTRTEKTHLRMDRLQGILISAMLQSRQAWLPDFPEPTAFSDFLSQKIGTDGKLIAHCEDGAKVELSAQVDTLPDSRTILIGPEGDFTPDEIKEALAHGFAPVALGPTRLRTETAAIFAAALLRSRFPDPRS
jgi:16S rRNA (uracil1498-N3)-methyltransferase